MDRKSPDKDNVLQDSEAVFRIAAFRYHETLENIMDRDVYLCSPDDPVQAVADEMARRRISSVIVADDRSKPIGIVTERDMVRKVVAGNKCQIGEMKISEIMTSNPVSLPPDGTLFDALSVLSRDMIKHLPVVSDNRVTGIITLRQIMKIRYAEPFGIIGQLEKADTTEEFKAIKEELIYLAKEKLESNTDPADIVSMLSLINSGIHKRLLKKALQEEGTPPPVDYCFFVTGSHGRRENLLFPDQDFCVITADCSDKAVNQVDHFFLNVSQRFSTYLHEAGFPYCPGKIMGQNPQWRKRISDWKSFVTHVFKAQDDFTVRHMTLIFDSSFLYGDRTLFDSYISHAFDRATHNYNVLRQMHDEEEGRHRVPLGFFHTFITEKEKGHRGEIDMKKSGLIFIIEAARILALKNGIRETSTLGRIQALVREGIVHRDDSEYFENAYRVILHHTLQAQVTNYLTDGSDNYFLAPRTLSHMHQEMLKESFKAISKLQDVVASEFGELIL